MNIAMYGHKRIPSREGGVEIVVSELASRMASMGHHVVCYNRSGDHVSGKQYNSNTPKVFHGIRVIPVWTFKKKGLAAMTSSLAAAYRAAKSSADVIHVHAEGPAATCGYLKRKHKRVVVTIHGLDWQRAKWGRFAKWYLKCGERQAAKHADEIIVLSRNVQEYFRKEYDRNTTYIPNGVNKSNPIPAEEITKQWNLKKNEYVLFVGRLVPEKGLMVLINAWKSIVTDKKLVIAGGSSDTEEFSQELKIAASSIGDVIFTDFVQGRILDELYSNAYVYVLPSDLEGMPLSLLEAMSFGNCCLVSSIPECVEVVEDMAVVFERSNQEALREKLQMLLDSPETVLRYQEMAADFITRKYNWDFVVEQTLALYKDEQER